MGKIPAATPIEPATGPNPAAGAPAVDDEHDNPIEVLLDLLERFEVEHPDLVKAINDVSHYLSGLGI